MYNNVPFRTSALIQILLTGGSQTLIMASTLPTIIGVIWYQIKQHKENPYKLSSITDAGKRGLISFAKAVGFLDVEVA